MSVDLRSFFLKLPETESPMFAPRMSRRSHLRFCGDPVNPSASLPSGAPLSGVLVVAGARVL